MQSHTQSRTAVQYALVGGSAVLPLSADGLAPLAGVVTAAGGVSAPLLFRRRELR